MKKYTLYSKSQDIKDGEFTAVLTESVSSELKYARSSYIKDIIMDFKYNNFAYGGIDNGWLNHKVFEFNTPEEVIEVYKMNKKRTTRKVYRVLNLKD